MSNQTVGQNQSRKIPTTCYLCGRQVIWGRETVYSEIGTLICFRCFEEEAARKGIIVQDGRILSNHRGFSTQQGRCVSCLRCCLEIGCALLDPDQGCLIYNRRPQACRDFFCKELLQSNSGKAFVEFDSLAERQ